MEKNSIKHPQLTNDKFETHTNLHIAYYDKNENNDLKRLVKIFE